MSRPDQQYESRRDYSILFADIERFSRLKAYQQKQYVAEVLTRISDVLYRDDNRPEQANTWGDGLVAFFSSHTNAVRCALTLRDTFRNTPWEDMGLPPLRIRIALHIGEVFVGYNPVKNDKELIGTEINRAARLEPVVSPNHVYATTDFVRLCKTDNVQFQYLGKITLPKGWGVEEIYVVGWAHEILDTASIKASMDTGLMYSQGLLLYPPSSKFGSRLSVSSTAKLNIAKYCAKSDFWKSEDVVFIESGTLPVYIMVSLYLDADPVTRPKLVVTNNLACSTIAMMAKPAEGSSYTTYPEDRPADCILVGGRVLDDYAATMPEDLMEEQDMGYWQSDRLLDYFHHKAVNHVIMMVTRMGRVDGPCAVSLPMRRFKKLLLRYVNENPNVHLSILAESEKLAGRRGWQADAVDLPESGTARYWEDLLQSGRVTVIAANSPEMPPDQLGLVEREIRAMRDAGASCVLLNEEGIEVFLD